MNQSEEKSQFPYNIVQCMETIMTREERIRIRKRIRHKKRIQAWTLLVVLLMIAITLVGFLISFIKDSQVEPTLKISAPVIQENLLTPNNYSRPQTKLSKINGVVVHYTANPGTDAEANRNYFNNLSKDKTTYASSHYIIGLDGTIIQCIPLNEIAYASNDRNEDTISIECCHPDESGKFNDETYQSLVWLVAWLSGEYNLKKSDVIRHYDVSGKLCPLYYVEHEEAWNAFKQDVFHTTFKTE